MKSLLKKERETMIRTLIERMKSRGTAAKAGGNNPLLPALRSGLSEGSNAKPPQRPSPGDRLAFWLGAYQSITRREFEVAVGSERNRLLTNVEPRPFPLADIGPNR